MSRDGHIVPAQLTRRSFVATAAGAFATLGLSGCSPSAPEPEPVDPFSQSYDVVVVGGGAAGMSAALAASDTGAQGVLLVEKAASTGGNLCFATSGMNAANTIYQQQADIQDTAEQFASDTLAGGHDEANPELVGFMCASSADAILWLAAKGMALENIVQTPGASIPRCHRPHDGSAVGALLVPGLESQLQKAGVTVVCQARATGLAKDATGRVVAVDVEAAEGAKERVPAKAVVLAAGGLCSDPEAVRAVRPDLAEYASTNQPTCTGDGYDLATEAGATLIGMERIQAHATVSADIPEGQPAHVPIAAALRTSGAVLINAQGARFCDETATRDVVAAALAAQEEGVALLVFPEEVAQQNSAVEAVYRPLGIVLDASDANDLATQLKMDAGPLVQTIGACTAIAQGQSGDAFGRANPPALFEGALHAIKVAPGVHYEMGGVWVDTSSRALNEQGAPIAGLYAAGEVTGGIHGANRISGNGVCDAIVMGRNAGQEAAAFAKGESQ